MTTASASSRAPSVRSGKARPRRARPLRTEAGKGVWAALVTGLLMYACLAEIHNDNRQYLAYSWVWTHDTLHSRGLLLGGSFAVAAGWWHGGRERRRGTVELLSSVPASILRRTAPAATPAVLWPVVSYLLTVAASLLLAWTTREIPYGRPSPTLIAVDAVAVAALGLLGFVAGRVIRWWPAAPALAVLAGYCMHALAGGNLPGLVLHRDALRALSPTTAHMTPWEVPVWWYAPVAALWFAAPAVAALLAHSGLRRAAVVPLAVALAAGGALAANADGLWRTDRAATALSCDEGRPQVCTVPSRAPSADASDSLAGVRAELRRVPGAPSRLIEVPFPLTGHPVEKARGRGDALVPPPLADFNVRPEHYAEAAAHEIAVFGCRKTVDGTTPVPEKYSAAVAAWLAPSAGDAAHGSGRRVLERVKTMPEHARTAWLGDYFTAVRDCRPGRIEAP